MLTEDVAKPRPPVLSSIALHSVATGWIAALYGGLYVAATADFAATGTFWIFGWPFLASNVMVTGVHLVLAGIGGARVPSPLAWVRSLNVVLDPRGEPQAAPRGALALALARVPSLPAANALAAMGLAGVVTLAMTVLEWWAAGSERNVLPIAYGGTIATLLYGSTTFVVTEILVSRPCQRLRLAAVRRGLDPYIGDAVGTWIRVVTLAAPAILALIVVPNVAMSLHEWWPKLVLVLLASGLCVGLALLQALSIRIAASDLGLAASRLTGKEPALFITGAIDAHLVEMARAFNDAASQVDRSLQISAARYSALFEGAGDGILIVDAANGRVLEANRRALELTGYGEQALKSRPFESLFHPGSEVSVGEDPGAYRWQHGALILRGDGGTCPVDVAVSLVMVQDQTLLQAILHDVSGRERIERELRESVARLEGLYHLAVTLGGSIQQVAAHVATTLASLLDAPVVAVERHEGAELEVLALSDHGTLGATGRMPLAGTPCERVHVHRSACAFADAAAEFPTDTWLVERGIRGYLGVPVIGHAGEVAGVVAVMDTRPRTWRDQDLRLLSAFGQRLARALDEEEFAREREAFVQRLIESDRLKSEFMGMMSHELRTPLNIFIGYTEILLDAARSAGAAPGLREHENVLERMLDAGCVLTNLVEDTLSVLRLESAGVRVNRERLDLGALFEELRSAERLLRAASPVAEEWRVADDMPPLVCDRLKLRQVLTNLVGNARKFTRAGSIEIQAVRAGADVEITVRDTGCGIAPGDLPHVFDLYRQAASPDTHGGCGIGLYIVRRYCELLGGRVDVESEVGRGTCFRVVLPIGDAGALPRPVAASA